MNTMVDTILARLPDGDSFTLAERVAQILDAVKVDATPTPNPTTRKFTREYLRDELDLPDGDNQLKLWIVEVQDHLTLYGLIFRDNNQPIGYAWQITFTIGIDDDESGPWEHEPEVECTLVKLVPKMSKAWIPAVMPESGT